MLTNNGILIRLNGPANQHTAHGERIIEFHAQAVDKGGLISFRVRDDGTLDIQVYRCDHGVTVNGRPVKIDG